MQILMLKGKLHRAVVTETILDYEGSIGIDKNWIEKVGFLPNEQVHVLNINTGKRLITYVLEEPRDSKKISINGAAARTAQVGDRIIILSYAWINETEARWHQPKILSFT